MANLFGRERRPVCVPKKILYPYAGAFALAALSAFALGYPVLAFLIFGVGVCGFLLLDLLFDIRINPPKKKGGKVFAVIACASSGCTILALVYFYLYLYGCL